MEDNDKLPPLLQLGHTFSYLKRDTSVDMKDIFEVVSRKNKDVLNQIVGIIPSLLDGPLSFIIENKPEIINFVNKEKIIKSKLNNMYKNRKDSEIRKYGIFEKLIL